MKIAIVHLSDIHFRADGNVLSERVDLLSGTIWSRAYGTTAQFLVLTGDIAFSGDIAEYQVAEDFVRALVDAAPKHLAAPEVHVVVLPGNHDCSFAGEHDARDLLLSKPTSELAGYSANSSVVRTLLEVQEEFWKFSARITSGKAPSMTLWSIEKPVADKKVRVVCLNSAVASRLSEAQGQLFLLDDDLDRICHLPAVDLQILAIHHPLNWFEANNAIRISTVTNSCADMLLTGHQHVESSYVRKGFDGSATVALEAPVLQGEESHSGLRFLVIDLEKRLFTSELLEFDGREYVSVTPDETWHPLERDPGVPGEPLPFDREFQKFLFDPGVGFTHPRKVALSLQDLFVPPDVTVSTLGDILDGFGEPKRVDSEDSLDYLTSSAKCVIVGAESSGKSALSKQIAGLLKLDGVCPLLVDGRDLKSSSGGRSSVLLRREVQRHYGQGASERFWGLTPDRRAIIVDDFHLCKLNPRLLESLLKSLAEVFGRIYLFADEIYRFEELYRNPSDVSQLSEFQVVELREFGFRLRGRLIERWHRLGRGRSAGDHALAQDVRKSELFVESLLGRNLLPSYPFAVLAILQVAEASREVSREAGSFGSMYEALIIRAMAEGASSTELDIAYSFLARIAWAMLQTDREFLSPAEIELVAAEYEAEVAVKLDLNVQLRRLEERRVLTKSEGEWSFRYPYIFFYFAARAFRSRVGSDPGARDELLRMADHVYSERNSNVLVFYLLLTQDIAIVEHVLANAKCIYSSFEPCDFDLDVAFLDDLLKGSLEKPVGLLEGSADERDRARARVDEEAALVPNAESDEEVAYREDLDELIKINIALKTLQILGQFVRNFPGSLSADLKRRIVEECYFLGLRSLNAVLKTAEGGLDDLRRYFAELARERGALYSHSEAQRVGDQGVLWLTRGCAFGIVKRISNAVGIEELERTYGAVISGRKELSVRVIDVSVKLDHFAEVPMVELHDLKREASRSYFTTAIVRDLVRYYMAIFPVPSKPRQKLLAWLGVSGPQRPYNPNRRLKS